MAPPLNLRWSVLATHHLEAAWQYVAQDNAAAADQLLERVLSATEALPRYPEMGRPGRVEGTRELVIPGTPFVIAYRTRRSEVQILAVLHGARRWPEKM